MPRCSMLLLTILLPAFLAPLCAPADTIYLHSGVQVDGVVKERESGVFEVDAGGRKVLYRPEEVARIEVNEQTGRLDMEQVRARWEARNQELIQLTGLTAEQRNQVRDVLYELQKDDLNQRRRLREQLMAMQEEFDVVSYLEHILPELSHRLAPPVIEAIYWLDSNRALPILREHIDHVYFGAREKAIELLTAAGDAQSGTQMLRGLADHEPAVQVAALNAAATLGLRQATPALIELLGHQELRIEVSSQRALERIWADTLGGAEPPKTRKAWQTFWDSRGSAAAGAGIQLASLEPLIPEEYEFQDE